MIKGFRDFITRGNVIDLAVAVVIGAAFTALVGVFTSTMIDPLITWILGGGVAGGQISIGRDQVLDFGALLNGIITFLITAAVVYFIFVIPMNKWRDKMAKEEEAAADEIPADIALLREIRDELVAKRTNGSTDQK